MVYTINGEQLTRRKLVTIDGSQVTTQTGIPLMLNIDLPNVATDGKDVRLAKLDGTPIAREIECVDVPNTDSVTIHYPFDTVASTDSQFYVYWGNANLSEPAADSTYGSEAVWDSNYVYVSHMADVTTSTIKDSTSNGRTSTKLSANNPIEYNAPFGKAQDFSSDYITIPDSADFDFTNYTFESYHYRDTDIQASIMSKLWDGSARSWEFNNGATDDNMQAGHTSAGGLYVWSAADSVPIQTWHYTTLLHNDASTSQWYIDGAASGSAVDIGAVNFNAASVRIGDRSHASSRVYFDGKIAEVRLSNILRSTGYVSTTSNSINNPTAGGTAPFYKSISTPQHQRRTPHFVN